MNAIVYFTKDYENNSAFCRMKNKANQSQNASLWTEAQTTKYDILNKPSGCGMIVHKALAGARL